MGHSNYIQWVIIGGILVSILSFYLVYLRISKRRSIDLIDWFNIFAGTFLGGAVSFVVWGTYSGLNEGFWFQIISQKSHLLWIYVLVATIFVVSLFVGAKIADSKRWSTKSKRNHFSTPKAYHRVHQLAWFFLVLGFFSYWLYARAYGGFLGLLEASTLIRSGIFESLPYNPFSFLIRFGGFLFFSSFLFYGLLKLGFKKERQKIIRIGFFLSFILSIYVLYSWLGRIGFIVYLLTFPLAHLLIKYKNRTAVILKSFKFLPLFIVLVILITKLMDRGHFGEEVLSLFVAELSFPLASFLVALDFDVIRWFKDILQIPFYILPQSIWNILLGFDTASHVNTELIMGAKKGEAGVTGAIPVDILTLSIVQIGVPGVVLLGLAIPPVLKSISNYIIYEIPHKINFVIYAYLILNVALLSVLYGDPSNIIVRNFHIIIGVISLHFFLRYRIKWKME